MLTALLLTSLSLAPAEAAVAAQQEPPVKVWLSKKGDLKQGDRLRVYAHTESDGYLVIISTTWTGTSTLSRGRRSPPSLTE